MDDIHLPRSAHEKALSCLANLNYWSRSHSGHLQALRDEARRVMPRSLRVLDVATGSGDIPIQLARRARQNGVHLSMSACDISSVEERAVWRSKALAWLKLDFEDFKGDNVVLRIQKVKACAVTPILISCDEHTAQWPEADRTAWRVFWDEVDAIVTSTSK